MDDKSKVVTDKNQVLLKIKNNLTFNGIAKLDESLMCENKSLYPIYSNYKQNLDLNPYVNFEIIRWVISPIEIQMVKNYVQTVVHANPYTYYAPHMENVSPDIKVFNVLELRTKCEYWYLLKDKQD